MAKTWTVLCVLSLAVGVCTLTGCGALGNALDWIFGVDESGRDKPGPSPAEVGGGLLGTVIPGVTTILTGVGGLWAALRGRNYKKALVESVKVVEAVGSSDLKKGLSFAHAKAGVQGIVEDVLNKYVRSKRSPLK
jgi:hypothetical protein